MLTISLGNSSVQLLQCPLYFHLSENARKPTFLPRSETRGWKIVRISKGIRLQFNNWRIFVCPSIWKDSNRSSSETHKKISKAWSTKSPLVTALDNLHFISALRIIVEWSAPHKSAIPEKLIAIIKTSIALTPSRGLWPNYSAFEGPSSSMLLNTLAELNPPLLICILGAADRFNIRFRLFGVNVLSVSLYGSSTWKLTLFVNTCLRRVIGVL